MNLIINGKKEQFDSILKLGDLLRHLRISEEESGFAVALNEEVVFRSTWQNVSLTDGDRIEIIRATQGG
jgi:sulfur carrier protein